MKNIQLNKIFHQSIRTQIMAYLLDRGETDYSTLKKDLNLSDGHMSTHIKELLKHKYLLVKKIFLKNKPKTLYCVSALGKKSFKQYVEQLKKIIGL